MSHWAEINENNIVVRVLVGDNNSPDEGEAFMNSLGGTWVKTSYNNNFAGIGFTYDSEKNIFIAPKPFASWIFNEEDLVWNAPVAKPEDGKNYIWDEETTSWAELPEE